MDQDADSAPKTQLRHLGEVLVVMVGAYLFAGVSVGALGPALVSLELVSADGNDLRLAQTVIQFVAIGVVALWYTSVIDTDRLIRWAQPTARGLALIGGGVIMLVATNIGINQLLSTLGFASGENVAVTAGVGDPNYYLVMVVISLVFVGPAEELLFRGVVQGRLRESWGVWPAIIGATVLFGVIHIPAVSGGTGAILSYVLTAAVLGLVLGYLYERTGNIVVPAVIHGANNAFVFGFLYLAEAGIV